MIYRTIVGLRGVDAYSRPVLIAPESFITLQQLRLKQKIIQNFPGWKSIVDQLEEIFVNDVPDIVNTVATLVDDYPEFKAGQAVDGGICTLIDELIRFDNTRAVIVGGLSKIYRFDFQQRKMFNISSGFTFHADMDNPWVSFFFANMLYFVNKVDGLFKTDGITVQKVANAPTAKSGGVLNNYILLWNTFDGTDHPQRIQWAAEGTDNEWTPTPSNDAGGFDITDEGDVGVGMLPLGNDMILYKDRTIIPLTFVGGNEVFGRRTTVAGIGLLGPYGVLDIGDEHLLMGNDQFYGYKGGNDLDSQIGLAIRDYVYSNLHPIYRNRVRSLYMEQDHEALFMYPSNGVADGIPDKCVVYNIEEQVWYGPFDMKCTMSGFTTRGFSLVVDDVPDIVDTVQTIVDQYPGAVGGAANVFSDALGDLHEIGLSQDANGSEIVRVLESGDHLLSNGAIDPRGNPVSISVEAVFLVSQLFVEIGDLTQAGIFEIYLGSRMEQDDPIVFTSIAVIDATHHRLKISTRMTGRWFRIRIVARNSQPFSLTSYQYGFNVVGRR